MEIQRAILTGFFQFGKYSVNPTEVLLNGLKDQVMSGHLIYCQIFPTKIFEIPLFFAGETIALLVNDFKAKVIISFGLASEARGLRIESCAVNWVENDKYCTPQENRRPVDRLSDKKEVLKIDLAKWDIAKMFAGFRKYGIPFEPTVSTDAGGFCCNALIYRVLQRLRLNRISIPYIFIHLPCTPASILSISDFDKNKVLITEEQLAKAVEIILTCYR